MYRVTTMLGFLAGLLAGALILTCGSDACAAVRDKQVTYMHDGVEFRGYLAWDDAVEGKRPGVLVVHEWWGLNDYARRRARELAELGYVALACDMYGEGKTAEHPQQAGEMASAVRANVDRWRARATEALRVLAAQPQCDATRLAAIGYCFGGSTALQLAYTGADLKAVVTFHAALPTPTAEEAKAIKATVLVQNGADDTLIPAAAIDAFRKALDAAGVDYEFVNYPGARHSFTVADADRHGLETLQYNADADRQSWDRMKQLLERSLRTSTAR